MLPDSFQQIIDSYDFIELEISISMLQWTPGQIDGTLVFTDQEDSNVRIEARLSIPNCLDFHFHKTYDRSSLIKAIDDHPLLWRFTDTQTSLYFNGTTRNTEKLGYQLWQIHDSLMLGYIPFDKRILSTLNGKFGLLTKGPKKLLNSFLQCLKAAGIQGSIMEDYFPDQHALQPEVLFIGESYFIAPKGGIVAEVI